ncbi:Serine/threonine protein kinase [Candidatus Terasakiella magnetica]|uniref:Serine/threonine protein kinase n=1 Tax=Candidatus Terasakiella magnetica TaxID=1867952 RepID=A0A1C3RI05_9PROT|nr:bifunctional protein-serine/threonine kinase/phosphatase [Candidatus Terasakiella magnetica]SCA56854.1 Serine/threonine protein kinase [Candidatus Terasakiella magnetica]
MNTDIELKIGQHSQSGRKEENQDSYGVLLPEGNLLTTKGCAAAIADGMSGSDASKEASESCVKTLFTDYFATPESWSVTTSVSKVLSALNRWLHGQGQSRFGSEKGMVSTLSALIFKSNTGHVFHVGDSRIYLLRDGVIEQITRDHRLRVSAEKEYLSRAMGIELNVDIDYKSLTLEKGDIFIFTTDGVHDFIPERHMIELIKQHQDNLDHAAQEIVSQAYENDSDDNLTCQIVEITNLAPDDEATHIRRLQELPFPPELEPGMILDGYEIQRELHASKRSQVYLAKDQDTGLLVALKTLSVNYEDDPTFINLFLREEWIGKRLSSPHVMKVLEPSRGKNFLYYISEFIEGPTLGQWMRDNPNPSLDEVRKIIKQIALGLRAFHRKEMVHQDLKPDNIVIDRSGTVKIIDFGSTRIYGLEEVSTPIEQLDLLGTVDYTAPEYHLGTKGTSQVDLYSLGVIAYEMLTGKLPYDKGFSSKSAVHKLVYTPASEHNEAIPVWFDKALERAVHKERNKRYPVFSEFLKDLEKPNPSFTKEDNQPMMASNPKLFWQVIALVSLLVNFIFIAGLIH